MAMVPSPLTDNAQEKLQPGQDTLFVRVECLLTGSQRHVVIGLVVLDEFLVRDIGYAGVLG
jgi:hypothetical protein